LKSFLKTIFATEYSLFLQKRIAKWSTRNKIKIKIKIDMGRLLKFEILTPNWWVGLSTDFQKNKITG
jgi:hypothetical protein